MVTTRQIVNGYVRAVKAAEREQRRQAREAAKHYKEQLKQQQIADSHEAYQTYQNYIETLISVHHTSSTPIDWKKIEEEPMPLKPVLQEPLTRKAKAKAASFTPSVFDKVFGYKRKLNRLETALEDAKRKDKAQFEQKIREYDKQNTDWQIIQDISIGIKQNNPAAFRSALNYFDPFSDISEIGTSVQLSIESDHIEVYLKVNENDIIPDQIYSLTTTGKLSKRNMTKTRFNELYQDHICSAALRVANEIFSFLPLDLVGIHAISNVLNSNTGHLEERPILSVAVSKNTIRSINLLKIDPSDSMDNFVHNMSFTKTKGFKPVEKVDIKNLLTSK